MTIVELYNIFFYGEECVVSPESVEFRNSIEESVEETLRLYVIDEEFIKDIKELKAFLSRIFDDKDLVVTYIEEFIGDNRLTNYYSESHVNDRVFYDEEKQRYYVTTDAYKKIMKSDRSSKAISQLFSKFNIIKEKGKDRKFQSFRKYGCNDYFIVINKIEAKRLLEEDMFDI